MVGVNVRPLPTSLTTRPFTAAQALAAGVGRGVLEGPNVRRILVGVYVASEVEVTPLVRIQGALLVLPPSALALGVTALWLHGVEISVPAPMRFVTDRSHQVRRAGMSVVRAVRMPSSHGRAVSPEHAFLTASTELDLVDLVSAGDRLVRLRCCSLNSLLQYTESLRGRSATLARRAVPLVRERVDSFRETRLRLCLTMAGMPEPECNIVLKTGDHPIGRVDLLLDEYRVIVEYEGDQHRTDKKQWSADIHRGEDFAALGYRTVRVTAAHLRRPRSVVWRVHDALRAGGYVGPEPTFGREWCFLFERRVQ